MIDWKRLSDDEVAALLFSMERYPRREECGQRTHNFNTALDSLHTDALREYRSRDLKWRSFYVEGA